MNRTWMVLVLTLLIFVEYSEGDTNPCSSNSECKGVKTYCGRRVCRCLAGWEGTEHEGDIRANDCPNDYDECYWAKFFRDASIACNPRGPHIKCVNTVGSFKCFCENGYTGSYPKCVDIDECSYGICPPNSDCTNLPGTYLCNCSAGFEKSRGFCVDIDECAELDLNDCHELAQCINKPGTYKCQCQSGYYGNGRMGDYGCIDDNECSGRHGCHKYAYCINRPGHYKCVCRTGYTGNGKKCKRAAKPTKAQPTNPPPTPPTPADQNSGIHGEADQPHVVLLTALFTVLFTGKVIARE